MFRSSSKVGDVIITQKPRVEPKMRLLQTSKIMFLLIAPGCLLIALTAKGWAEVRSIRSAASKVDLATKQTLQLAYLVDALQIERGRSALLISSNWTYFKHLQDTLRQSRLKTDSQLQLISDWTNINVESLKSQMIHWEKLLKYNQSRGGIIVDYVSMVRQMVDQEALDLKENLDLYTTVIVCLINSGQEGLAGLEESVQISYLETLATFMMAVDQLGQIRALGGAIWVSCNNSSRSWLIERATIWYALINIINKQSKPMREAYSRSIKPGNGALQMDEIEYLASEQFEKDCLQTSMDHRLQVGNNWFENVTNFIESLGVVRKHFILSLFESLEELYSTTNTTTIVYVIVIVLTCFFTLGSAYTLYNIVNMSWVLQEFSWKLMEKTEEVKAEKKQSDALLNQMLPPSIAEQLKQHKPVQAEYFDEVTIFFSDIVGFTSFSAQTTPGQVIELLNSLYSMFDSCIEEYDVYKVETIGDAYMVASGLPIPNGDNHAKEIAYLSLTLQRKIRVTQFVPDWEVKLRIGIHTGPCAAGVVGLKMPRYCLFGDTVNTASRMESVGEAMKINISEPTFLKLKAANGFLMTPRGFTNVKGKGQMATYWLQDSEHRKVSENCKEDNDSFGPMGTSHRLLVYRLGTSDKESYRLATQIPIAGTEWPRKVILFLHKNKTLIELYPLPGTTVLEL